MATEEADVSVPLLESDGDPFKGVTVKEKHISDISVDQFSERLSASLSAWRKEGKRGVWLRIPIHQSDFIPVAVKQGFVFHHAKPDRVMLCQWLPVDEENVLPTYATHNIGVAGFVVNSQGEVLLVQEKWLRNLKLVHWKLPGGVAETGEEIWETAIRETFEETGVKSEFVAMLCFRHMHGYRWGTDDLYFACLLRPLATEIKINPAEIADAKWMNIFQKLSNPDCDFLCSV